MPRRATSRRTDRSAAKKHLRNLRVKKDLKKAFKEFQGLLGEKKVTEAKALIKTLFSKLDKAAKKGILHPNTAARKKSGISRRAGKTA